MDRKYLELAKHRELDIYLTIWLSEIIFTGGGKVIRSSCIFVACKVASGERFALAPAMISYFCAELQTLAFMVRLRISVNHVFSENILYAWFVYHCPSLHKLGDSNVDKPFYTSVASGKSNAFTLINAWRHFWNFHNFVFCRNPLINAESVVPKKGMVLRELNIDLVNLTYG